MQLEKNKLNTYHNKKNIGIDILRILSMFMIVIGHLIWHGVIIENVKQTSNIYYIVYFIDIIAACAVNCYAITTGYLLCESKFKISRIILLYMQVQFYSICIAITIYFLSGNIGYKEIISSIFPILRNQYWYFTSYFALFCLTPFLNKFIELITIKEFKNIIITIIVLFSLLPTIAINDIFGLNRGYSVSWLVLLYLIGAYIKKNGDSLNIKNYIYFITYIIFSILILILELISIKFLGTLGFSLIDVRNILVGYTSIFILIMSICLFIGFSKLKINIKNIYFKKYISIIGSATFGVYLIHDNILVRNLFIKDKIIESIQHLELLHILKILILSIIIFIICIIIEYLRNKIFLFLKLDNLANKLTTYLINISKFIDCLIDKLIRREKI